MVERDSGRGDHGAEPRAPTELVVVQPRRDACAFASVSVVMPKRTIAVHFKPPFCRVGPVRICTLAAHWPSAAQILARHLFVPTQTVGWFGQSDASIAQHVSERC